MDPAAVGFGETSWPSRDDRGVNRTVPELVSELLDNYATATHLEPEFRTASWVPLYAMLVRSRGLLRSILVLEEAGRTGDGGDELCRSIFELAVTARWLDDDLEANAKVLVQASNRQWRQIVDADSHYQPMLDDALERWRHAYGDEEPEASLPSLEQRLRPPLAMDYIRYRLMSAQIHPSLVGLATTFTVTDDGGLDFHEDRAGTFLTGKHLAFAAMHVWLITTLVYRGTGTPLPEGLVRLSLELNDHILGEAGATSARTGVTSRSPTDR